MLRRLLQTVTTTIKRIRMADSAVPQEPVVSEAVKEKRTLEDGEDTVSPAAKKLKQQSPGPMQGRSDRKRKVALLIAYCGAGYYGIQVQKNGDFRTIESEMMKALVAAGLIPQEHADTPQKMSFQRAARTDKNVSAVGNVLSLKMIYNEGVSEIINTHLPPEIRAIGCIRTTQGFDSKNHCTARTYKYMLPTYSFAPVEKFITKDYRLPEGIIQRVNDVLAKYVGTHNFHNFTSGKKPNDPSSKRYIMSFESGSPFVREGMEFVVLTVKGQSFMLHHIRKMIGLMTAIVRGYCGEDVITKSWGPQKMDIPKAPGVGLFLDELFFAGYNKKFGNDGMHEPLVWDKYQESLKTFREERVLSHIVRSELTESVMLQWLATLQCHKFDVIDPAQEVPPDGEREKDPAWWRTKALLRKMDKAKAQATSNSSVIASESPDQSADSCAQQNKMADTDSSSNLSSSEAEQKVTLTAQNENAEEKVGSDDARDSHSQQTSSEGFKITTDRDDVTGTTANSDDVIKMTANSDDVSSSGAEAMSEMPDKDADGGNREATSQ